MFESLAKHIFETIGIPKQDIGNMIVKQFSPSPYSATAIREYLPDEYKDQDKAMARKGKTKDLIETKLGKKLSEKVAPELTKKLSAKEEKINTLQSEISDYVKQLNEAREQVGRLETELKTWNELIPLFENEHIIKIRGEKDSVRIKIIKDTKEIIVWKVEGKKK